MRSIVNASEKKEVWVRAIVDDGHNEICFGKCDGAGDQQFGRLYEVSFDNSIDNDSWQASMSFRNQSELGESLDPMDPSSDFNNGTISDYLLDRYHKVWIEISKDEGSNWYRMFEGWVGEVTARRTVGNDDIIDFSPFDYTIPLKDLMAKNLQYPPDSADDDYVYNSIDLCNQILEDNDVAYRINKSESDDPGFNVEEYEVKDVSVWEAIKNVIKKTGFKIMYRPLSATNFDLVVVDPLRTTWGSGTASATIDGGDATTDTFDDTIDGGDAKTDTWADTIDGGDAYTGSATMEATFTDGFDRREVSVSDKDVRTKVIVSYVSRKTGSREEVTKYSDTALSSYGVPDGAGGRLHRKMRLAEDDGSLIDTEDEANSLAELSLQDVKGPQPDSQFDFVYFQPKLQLYDKYSFKNVGDYEAQIGVTSISHTIDVSRNIGSTTVQGTLERVIGAHRDWLKEGPAGGDDELQLEKGDGRKPSIPEEWVDPDADCISFSSETYQTETNQIKAIVAIEGVEAPQWDVDNYRFQYKIQPSSDDWTDTDWKEAGSVQFQDSDEDDVSESDAIPKIDIQGLPLNTAIRVRYAAIDWEHHQGSPNWSDGTATYAQTQTTDYSINKVEIIFNWDSLDAYDFSGNLTLQANGSILDMQIDPTDTQSYLTSWEEASLSFAEYPWLECDFYVDFGETDVKGTDSYARMLLGGSTDYISIFLGNTDEYGWHIGGESAESNNKTLVNLQDTFSDGQYFSLKMGKNRDGKAEAWVNGEKTEWDGYIPTIGSITPFWIDGFQDSSGDTLTIRVTGLEIHWSERE